MNLKLYIIIIIYSLNKSVLADSYKFTNIKCEEYDRPFAIFKECALRIPKRSTVALNIYVKLFQLPVNNVSVSFSCNIY